MDVLAIDDELNFSPDIFTNGISGNPSHMDSYMTVIDYVALEKKWNEIKDKYTKEEWETQCLWWSDHGPVQKQLSLFVKRKIGE